MKPLTVTIRPAMEMDIGKKFVKFINSGFSHLHVTAHPEGMRKLNFLDLKNLVFRIMGG